jgi:hypothetical protein
MRVLVFPCGSEIGLEINAALRHSSHIESVGASSAVSNHGPYVYREYTQALPYANATDFIEALNKSIGDYRIDYIFPAHDSVMLRLAECAQDLKAAIIGSPVGTCRVCRSKRKTYQALGDVLRVPAVYAPDAALPFPVFLKPDVGQGSRGVSTANNLEELRLALARDPTLLVLELLPGEEYTVDCFTDRHGVLRFVGPRKRSRTMNGISVDTEPVTGGEFSTIAHTINGRFAFRGVWFFQLKRAEDGALTLLEVAPRVAGSMAMHRSLGVNLALLSVFDRAGFDVTIEPNSFGIVLDRALGNAYSIDLTYNHVYVDFDDTLVVGGEVSVIAVAFLYQCRNRGVKTHLLSRHKQDLRETLKRYALTELFDECQSIGEVTPKSRYIGHRDSIFIDDSFAERSEVHRQRGIPVFGPDAIECLMDWRG